MNFKNKDFIALYFACMLHVLKAFVSMEKFENLWENMEKTKYNFNSYYNGIKKRNVLNKIKNLI